MISDVLFDAIQEIERYQAEMPDSYDSIRAEIDEVIGKMRELQRRLDNPNVEEAFPEFVGATQ